MSTEFTVTEQMRAWGKAHGFNVDEYADWFCDYLANRTKKYKDNEAAFRNCVRSDWPGFRKMKPLGNRNSLPTEYRAERQMVNGKEWVPASATTGGYWR